MTIFNILLIIYGTGSVSKIKGMNEKQNNLLRLILIFPLFALCAFRALSVGNDTEIYYYGYSRIGQYASLFSAIQSSRYEIGYTVLCYGLHKIGASFLELQIIISTFIYCSLYRFFVKYSNNFAFSCFVFLTLRYAMSTMNVVRTWIAVAILLYTIPFIQKRKLIPFLLLVALAGCFHTTALVFIILYPAAKLKINGGTIFVTLISSVIVSLLAKPIFMKTTSLIGRYSGYLSSKYFVYESNIAVYLTLAIDIALFILIYVTVGRATTGVCELGASSNMITIEQIGLVCGLLVMAFGIIGLGNTIMDRISVYFGVLFTISIPLSLKHIEIKQNKNILYIAMLLALTAQYLAVMIMRPGWNGVTPYLFFWQH